MYSFPFHPSIPSHPSPLHPIPSHHTPLLSIPTALFPIPLLNPHSQSPIIRHHPSAISHNSRFQAMPSLIKRQGSACLNRCSHWETYSERVVGCVPRAQGLGGLLFVALFLHIARIYMSWAGWDGGTRSQEREEDCESRTS
jgi:hypothetical protein